MEIFIVWFILCILVGVFASQKGLSGVGFFFISFLLSPLIGIIIALLSRGNRNISEAVKIQKEGLKKCPKCAELIKQEAIVCRFCGNNDFTIEVKKAPDNQNTFSLTCEECGEKLKPGYVICDKCNHITLPKKKEE